MFNSVLFIYFSPYTHKYFVNEDVLLQLSKCINLTTKYDGKERKKIIESLFVCISSIKNDISFIKDNYV